MAIKLTPLASFSFDNVNNGPVKATVNNDYETAGLGSDDITFNPVTQTLFTVRTVAGDKTELLQFSPYSSGSPNSLGKLISEADLSSFLQTAVGLTVLPNGNLLIASARNDGINTEIVEVTPSGQIATNGFLNQLDPSNTTGKLTLPPEYYTPSTDPITKASNGKAGIGFPAALALTKENTLIVGLSQSGLLPEFSLTQKDANGYPKLLSRIDVSSGTKNLGGFAIDPTDPTTQHFIITDGLEIGQTNTTPAYNSILEVSPGRLELFPNGTSIRELSDFLVISRTDLSTAFPSLGPLYDPRGISFDPATKTAYIVFDNGTLDNGFDGKPLNPPTKGSNKVVAFSVDHAPLMAQRIDKFGLPQQSVNFTATDFTSAYIDGDNDPLKSITIKSLPKNGTLTLSGQAVTAGQVVSAANLGNLSYKSNAGFLGADTFSLTASDGKYNSTSGVIFPVPLDPATDISTAYLYINSPNAVPPVVTNTFPFRSAHGLIFNPTTGTLFATESYRVDQATVNSVAWNVKEIDPDTGAVIKSILQSEDAILPNVPTYDIQPTEYNDPTTPVTDETVMGMGVVSGTGTSRDGDLLMLSSRILSLVPRGQRIFEIDKNGKLVTPAQGGIDIVNPPIFSNGSAANVIDKIENGKEVLYVADFFQNALLRFNKQGQLIDAKGNVTANQTTADGNNSIDLNKTVPAAAIHGVEVDPATGNFLLVDNIRGHGGNIYEVTPAGALIATYNLRDLGRQYGISIGKTGADLEAFVNRFTSPEGITIDPATRKVYVAINDDIRNPALFNVDFIGNQIVTLSLDAQETVTTFKDENDGTSAGTGLSLRDAIIAANKSSSPSTTITLPAGTFKLTLDGNKEDGSLTGDLDIASGKTITIVGAGSGRTIIDASGFSKGNEDRVFNVLSKANLNLSNLTVTGGNIPDRTDFFSFAGGGILVNPGGNLNADNVVITKNVSANGAGIFVGDPTGKTQGGTAKVTNSTISNNKATFDGGGISALNGGKLTATNITVTGNKARRNAGGVGVAFGGSATVDSSVIENNQAIGTGTFPFGPVGVGGGAHLYDGNLTIRSSTIVNNQAGGSGGGIGLGGGTSPYTLTLKTSKVSANTADSNADGNGNGGGIGVVTAGTIAIKNTTITGNIDKSPAPGQVVNDVSGNFIDNGGNTITKTASAINDSLLASNSGNISASQVDSLIVGQSEPISAASFASVGGGNTQIAWEQTTQPNLLLGPSIPNPNQLLPLI